MKKQLLLATICLVASLNARATLFNSGSSIGTIPDGNLAGVTFSGTASDFTAGWTVSQLTVGLDISGGIDGNLFAYLVAPNGTTVQLLDRPGVTGGNSFGNMISGMTITLADGGQTINASSDLFNTSVNYAPVAALSGFNGVVANGTWQLFFADQVTGGGTDTLNSWSLDITAVPEPVNVALGIFGVCVLVACGIRFWRRRQNRVQAG